MQAINNIRFCYAREKRTSVFQGPPKGRPMEQIMRNIALPLARPGFSVGRITGQIWRLIVSFELALRVRRERRLLASLDEHALKDMGFNRGEASAEAGRSFWDVPVDRM